MVKIGVWIGIFRHKKNHLYNKWFSKTERFNYFLAAQQDFVEDAPEQDLPAAGASAFLSASLDDFFLSLPPLFSTVVVAAITVFETYPVAITKANANANFFMIYVFKFVLI